MEKCGCNMCVIPRGGEVKKAVDIEGYNVEDCPCKNCLVKVVCSIICKDVLDYCKTFDKVLKIIAP